MAGNLQNKLTGQQRPRSSASTCGWPMRAAIRIKMKFTALPMRRRIGTATSRDSSSRTSRSPTAKSICRSGRRFAPAEFATLRSAATVRRASNPTPARTTPTTGRQRDRSQHPAKRREQQQRRRGARNRRRSRQPVRRAGGVEARQRGLRDRNRSAARRSRREGRRSRLRCRPKCATPLSLNQEPDEPVARAAVPAEDRTTIKRVFER